jgi:hypothetical protein
VPFRSRAGAACAANLTGLAGIGDAANVRFAPKGSANKIGIALQQAALPNTIRLIYVNALLGTYA